MAQMEAKEILYWQVYRDRERIEKYHAGSPYHSIEGSNFPLSVPEKSRFYGLPAPIQLDQDMIPLDPMGAGLNTFWKPLKILGAGAEGMVQSWQYQGNPSGPTAPERRSEIGKMCVIKSAIEEDLETEADMMMLIRKTKATHCIQLARNPLSRQNDRLRFLYMEYCAGGDMGREIAGRYLDEKARSYPSEKNLWRTFHCLAKACMALHCGSEDDRDVPADWTPIIHFDLKPQNVMLGSRDQDEHEYRRPYKIGDFGLASVKREATILQKKFVRRRGTHFWLTPEQFTRRWDYVDLESQEDEPICGNYDSHSNVWAVGAIMWCLALLAKDIMPVHDGYRSSLDFALGGGSTYGKAIEASNYSHKLKVLILSCLMEDPRNRPGELDLLIQTAEGRESSAEMDEPGDDWDFEIALGNKAFPVVPGLFGEKNAASQIPLQKTEFPNFSNNSGAAGIAIRGDPRAEELERSSVKGVVDGSRKISISGIGKRRRTASGDSQRTQRQRTDPSEKRGTSEQDPFAQEDIEIPKFNFEHGAFPELPPRGEFGIISQWRAVFDVSAANKRPRDPAIFIWTPVMVQKYSQRYINRARLCGYTDGIQAANDFPEDMARLQLDWENQDYLARQQGDVVEQSLYSERAKMQLDKERAGWERVRRIDDAMNDISQVVGYTPTAFQTPGVPIEANLPRLAGK